MASQLILQDILTGNTDDIYENVLVNVCPKRYFLSGPAFPFLWGYPCIWGYPYK